MKKCIMLVVVVMCCAAPLCAESIDSLMAEAENGNSDAQYRLGLAYLHGIGVDENPELATHWLLQASERGEGRAGRLLGTIGYRWVRVEAEKGNGYAQNLIGLSEFNSSRRDEAAEWFMRASDRGVAMAQIMLHAYYFEKNDTEQADYWFQKSLTTRRAKAESGDPFSQYNAGDNLRGFDDRESNLWFSKAVDGLQKLASQGYAEAQYRLGQCYSNGYGVKEDKKQAAYWYREAAEHGHDMARNNLNQLSRQ